MRDRGLWEGEPGVKKIGGEGVGGGMNGNGGKGFVGKSEGKWGKGVCWKGTQR